MIPQLIYDVIVEEWGGGRGEGGRSDVECPKLMPNLNYKHCFNYSHNFDIKYVCMYVCNLLYS